MIIKIFKYIPLNYNSNKLVLLKLIFNLKKKCKLIFIIVLKSHFLNEMLKFRKDYNALKLINFKFCILYFYFCNENVMYLNM